MRRLCCCDIETPLLLPRAALLAYQREKEREEEKLRERGGANGREEAREG